MKPSQRLLASFCILISTTVIAFSADGPSPIEARLREQVRSATLQARSAQAELATAQAAQSALADEKKALTDQLAAARKQLAADKALSDKSTTELKAQLEKFTVSLTQYREALQKARGEQQTTSASLKAAEEELAVLKQDKIVLERKIADRETKNLQMFVLANQILSRFEDYGLGRALASKEPFIGKSRVKLENMVQDFEDQLNEQRIRE